MAVSNIIKNGDNKIDPYKVVTLLLPLLLYALIGFMFMQGMLQTEDTKTKLIDKRIAESQLMHSDILGHPVMVERVEAVKAIVAANRADIVKVKETVARIEARLKAGGN